MERTLSMIKPDGVARGLVGEIIRRFENAGMRIVALKMLRLTNECARSFYAEHQGKPFYENLTDFMSSGPIVAMVLEGENVIQTNRALMGATDYREASPGTIRHDFARDLTKNIVHGSDSTVSQTGKSLFYSVTWRFTAIKRRVEVMKQDGYSRSFCIVFACPVAGWGAFRLRHDSNAFTNSASILFFCSHYASERGSGAPLPIRALLYGPLLPASRQNRPLRGTGAA